MDYSIAVVHAWHNECMYECRDRLDVKWQSDPSEWRVDYCNAVLAGAHSAQRYITDKLGQRVLNAAACLVTGTRKFDRGLERLLHDDLHWLDVPERVQFKLGLTVRRCLRRRAPRYLVDYCTSVADGVNIYVPPVVVSSCRVTVSTCSAIGPSQWLVRCPGTHYRTVSTSRRVMTTFQMTVSNIHWKHFSLVDINVPSVEVFTTLHYINVHLLTYLLTSYNYLLNLNLQHFLAHYSIY